MIPITRTTAGDLTINFTTTGTSGQIIYLVITGMGFLADGDDLLIQQGGVDPQTLTNPFDNLNATANGGMVLTLISNGSRWIPVQ